MTDELIGLSEAARLVGVSRDLLKYYAKRGRCQPVWTPYGRAFTRAEIARFRAEREQRRALAVPA